MVRLLKPQGYFKQKYDSGAYALEKLYLMMEKQHNRGQEGAGIACVNMDSPVGTEYMLREKALGKDAITEVFSRVTPEWSEAQLFMGHLRYSTTGRIGLQYVHPFLRRNNWRAKNLCLCGNFNMTNIDEIFQMMVRQGQSPRIYSDSYITLELMGHRLDREAERCFEEAKKKGLQDTDITRYIEDNVQMGNVLRTTMAKYDGGYVMCGLTGSGEMFAMRDPWGIRPAFFYRNDEVVAVSSERAVLQTTFDLCCEDVEELSAGGAIIVHKNGRFDLESILPPQMQSRCSFERIYFSRGSDRDIYRERKLLGKGLTAPILKAIDGDVENTVFSFIPNTAEVAFYGMIEGLRNQGYDVRSEKVAWKDIKLRIRSVESTMQITKAMQLVASSKLRGARARMEASKPYMKVARTAVWDIALHNTGAQSHYVIPREIRQRCYIVIAGDRGLAGLVRLRLGVLLLELVMPDDERIEDGGACEVVLAVAMLHERLHQVVGLGERVGGVHDARLHRWQAPA